MQPGAVWNVVVWHPMDSLPTARANDHHTLTYGDVAILNARNSVFLKDRQGQPDVRRNRFTDVFVRRDGRWQLGSGHSSRIPEPTNK